MKCKHKNYKLTSYNRKILFFECKNCGHTINRKTTKQEERTISKRDKIQHNDIKECNKIYHIFQKKFENTDGTYKLRGQNFKTAVRKWAKKYPSVSLIQTDDKLATSSLLVFIQHGSDESYHGTTVIFIPQNYEATEFFISRYHNHQILRLLAEIQFKMSEKPEIVEVDEIDFDY